MGRFADTLLIPQTVATCRAVKCTTCEGVMRASIADRPYLVGGLPHVVLGNVTTHRCPRDGASFVEIERIGQLHRLLAEILANKPARLLPSEVRFLRDHLELSNRDFARVFGVLESQSSRWTSTAHPEQMSLAAEHFLRALAPMAPIELETDAEGMTRIVALSAAIVGGKFPPRDAEQETMPVKLRFVKARREWIVVNS